MTIFFPVIALNVKKVWEKIQEKIRKKMMKIYYEPI